MLNARRFLVILLMLSKPTVLYAYVDPGSGMLVFQGLIATIGGLIMFIKNPIKVLKATLSRIIKIKKR